MRHVMPLWPSVLFVLFFVRALYEQRGGEGAARLSLFLSSLVSVHQTTSGIGHLVKYQ